MCRLTDHFTRAPCTGSPEYVRANPLTVAVWPSTPSELPNLNSARNFGRLYSSTRTSFVVDTQSTSAYARALIR